MWICLNNGFFSAVEHKTDKSILVVRARRPGDLERHFPGYPVHETDGTDYQFRAFINKEVFGQLIAQKVEDIDYGNFKDSVQEHNLHTAYARVWAVMERLQMRPAYGSREKGNKA